MPTEHNGTRDLELRPTLVVGIGGTGTLGVMHAKTDMLTLFQADEGSGHSRLPFVQFLALDTTYGQERCGEEATALEASEFSSIAGFNANSILEQVDKFEWLRSWFPSKRYRPQNIHQGAMGIRHVGRLCYFVTRETSRVHGVVQAKLRQLMGEQQRQYRSRKGVVYDIAHGSGVDIHIVCSLCGGTGAGCLLDLAYDLRRWAQQITGKRPTIYAHLVLAEAFGEASAAAKLILRRNCCSALREIDYFMGAGETSVQYRKERVDWKAEDAPFNLCFLLNGEKKSEGVAGRDELAEMAGRAISTIIVDPLGKQLRDRMVNLPEIALGHMDDDDGRLRSYSSYGLVVATPLSRQKLANWLHRHLAEAVEGVQGGLGLPEEAEGRTGETRLRTAVREQFEQHVSNWEWRGRSGFREAVLEDRSLSHHYKEEKEGIRDGIDLDIERWKGTPPISLTALWKPFDKSIQHSLGECVAAIVRSQGKPVTDLVGCWHHFLLSVADVRKYAETQKEDAREAVARADAYEPRDTASAGERNYNAEIGEAADILQGYSKAYAEERIATWLVEKARDLERVLADTKDSVDRAVQHYLVDSRRESGKAPVRQRHTEAALLRDGANEHFSKVIGARASLELVGRLLLEGKGLKPDGLYDWVAEIAEASIESAMSDEVALAKALPAVAPDEVKAISRELWSRAAPAWRYSDAYHEGNIEELHYLSYPENSQIAPEMKDKYPTLNTVPHAKSTLHRLMRTEHAVSLPALGVTEEYENAYRDDIETHKKIARRKKMRVSDEELRNSRSLFPDLDIPSIGTPTMGSDTALCFAAAMFRGAILDVSIVRGPMATELKWGAEGATTHPTLDEAYRTFLGRLEKSDDEDGQAMKERLAQALNAMGESVFVQFVQDLDKWIEEEQDQQSLHGKPQTEELFASAGAALRRLLEDRGRLEVLSRRAEPVPPKATPK